MRRPGLSQDPQDRPGAESPLCDRWSSTPSIRPGRLIQLVPARFIKTSADGDRRQHAGNSTSPPTPPSADLKAVTRRPGHSRTATSHRRASSPHSTPIRCVASMPVPVPPAGYHNYSTLRLTPKESNWILPPITPPPPRNSSRTSSRIFSCRLKWHPPPPTRSRPAWSPSPRSGCRCGRRKERSGVARPTPVRRRSSF